MVHTVTTLSTMLDEHKREIQELNHTIDIQNDVKGIQAQMTEMQKTLGKIVARLPLLESSNTVHQPPP